MVWENLWGDKNNLIRRKDMRVVVALVIGICLMTTTALAAPADKFTDLPKSHWAYEAVSLLAKEGIIDGYSDKTFKGDKEMTRYEMAQVVAKAMANQSKANIALRALIDKLAVEFALDMNKISTRLEKVEKQQAKIKISGELSEQYKVKKENGVSKSATDRRNSSSTSSVRWIAILPCICGSPTRRQAKTFSRIRPIINTGIFQRIRAAVRPDVRKTKAGAFDLKIGATAGHRSRRYHRRQRFLQLRRHHARHEVQRLRLQLQPWEVRQKNIRHLRV
jgi:hypothetical protein